ncbi:methyltransferase type 11 [candidate division WWE3 bacterium CG08_land_8_20_14_0_20_40_13]|uniref:Methyltransferase type 11 n=1 Tax=candidate division WWE3 bacterium CG08_land_8_20_14_0_20_40_13 TaxID=1975084 RepID=A0A2H0XD78_UNCKA|nr:MAG: methyltransferase type 11 [candidate division WWE3 bacterium CG08_land_8_20_14_0_20_40_13]
MIKANTRNFYHTNEYVSLARFVSYYYQIDSVLKTNPKNVMEVGVGNKIVSSYLKEKGISVITLDINSKLNPDIVADVRDIPVDDQKFDTTLVCEVLEHIPFKDLETALSEIARITRNHAVISIPYSCAYFASVSSIGIPFFEKIFRISINIPYFIFKIPFFKQSGEHFWEMGRLHYQKKRFEATISEYFLIERSFQPILNPYHYFFICRPKRDVRI